MLGIRTDFVCHGNGLKFDKWDNKCDLHCNVIQNEVPEALLKENCAEVPETL